MMLTPEFEALLNDQEAGASSLLYRYLAVLSSHFSNEKLPQEKTLGTLNAFYELVSQAHPLMAIFPNLHDHLTKNLTQGEKTVLDLLNTFRQVVDANIAATVEAAKGLFFECDTIFTFSHSSIVRKAILEAKNAGAVFTIHTTEARPVREGVNLAKVLARAGIGVTLFTDAAMELAVKESDLILVGTDWYSRKGFVNKIGTHSALRMAKAYGKPFIILTDSTKQMNYEPENWEKDKHASTQVLGEQIENIQVRNPYFEWIPFQSGTDLIVNGKRLAAKDL